MLEMQKKLHENALANIQKAQADQKQQYDAKHNTCTKLKVSDVVLVECKKNDGRKGGKLEINFKGGPYTIAEDVGKGRLRLKDAQGNALKTAINCHRLKIWHDPKEAKLNQQSVSTSVMCASSCTLYLYDLYVAFHGKRMREGSSQDDSIPEKKKKK